MSGKGSKRRPSQVSHDKVQANWDNVFNKKMQQLCPMCEEGFLTAHIGENESFKGLEFHYSVCNACGSEVGTPEQVEENARLMKIARKEKNKG